MSDKLDEESKQQALDAVGNDRYDVQHVSNAELGNLESPETPSMIPSSEINYWEYEGSANPTPEQQAHQQVEEQSARLPSHVTYDEEQAYVNNGKIKG